MTVYTTSFVIDLLCVLLCDISAVELCCMFSLRNTSTAHYWKRFAFRMQQRTKYRSDVGKILSDKHSLYFRTRKYVQSDE